jgi:putative toxin-antitoxin system antitoxin component (TIGR02293 family)
MIGPIGSAEIAMLNEMLGVKEPGPRGLAEAQAMFSPPSASLEVAIRAGLPREALRRVAERLGGDAERASAIEHAIVPKTTLARRGAGRLTREESERTERLARLFVHAVAALGSEEDARLFMRRGHPELEGRSPLEAAITELGGRRVEDILHALEYGLPV